LYGSGSDWEFSEPATKVIQASDSKAAVDKLHKNVAACVVSSIEFVCRVDI
jgi:hypothetical protein